MIHAAKLIWNSNNWISPTFSNDQANFGIKIATKKFNYVFGLEEWLNNDFMKAHKMGYIDCYRASRHVDDTDILLFSRNPNNKEIYLIGKIFKARQIKDQEIMQIRDILNSQNWNDTLIKPIFETKESNNNPIGFRQYYNENFTSNTIVGKSPKGFIVNIKYDDIQIFEKRISLTELDAIVNTKWRRLSKRYSIENIQSDKFKSLFK